MLSHFRRLRTWRGADSLGLIFRYGKDLKDKGERAVQTGDISSYVFRNGDDVCWNVL